ncbi:uncharacterized protein KD926_001400 [Aspergillus affinis]|uniref:uncharacterized protein n=1 Tax=Aspergillus affinis TaxID=1070780 RepID=UPI0022FF39A8|nr:uncharacterized protein KD926_001400 [Aspergillus affinis]KAI9036706.1 hypothetical protein KD926_001400 [Aspergillus affinis]
MLSLAAGLHSPGNGPAAVVVTQMRNTFRQLRFGVLVGEQGNIYLGHVVVSKPVGEHSGVVQYDHGKAEVGQFRHTGYLFRAEYVHPDPHVSCRKCGCDSSKIVDCRAEDSDDDHDVYDQVQQLVVHRGTIAAGELAAT